VVLGACSAGSDKFKGFDCSECNLLLISIDTLRADHLSLYGYSRPTSPNLEALAIDAVVFDQSVNNGGWTLPVHMSMMTSLTPPVHNVLEVYDRLPQERITLAEVLKQAGYDSAAFADGGGMKGKHGFRQGFGRYNGRGGGLDVSLPKAFRWLDRHQGSRFFLFLHTYDVHSKTRKEPYTCPGTYSELYVARPPAGFDGCHDQKCATDLLVWMNNQTWTNPEFDVEDVVSAESLDWMIALYDGCINFVDAQLQKVFDDLKQRGLYDQTMIIVTSDHGEEFLDHGFFHHHNQPYEEIVRTPLIIKFPYSEFAGRRVGALASTIDLMPTVLDVLNLPIPDQAMGTSLLPLLVDDQPVRSVVQIAGPTGSHVSSALRSEQWKFVKGTNRNLLFDLTVDPEERRNLIDEEADVAQRMEAAIDRAHSTERHLLQDFEKSLSAVPGGVELSEDELEELRALGYIQ
jgi:arylsulfatase A-like enzyme